MQFSTSSCPFSYSSQRSPHAVLEISHAIKINSVGWGTLWELVLLSSRRLQNFSLHCLIITTATFSDRCSRPSYDQCQWNVNFQVAMFLQETEKHYDTNNALSWAAPSAQKLPNKWSRCPTFLKPEIYHRQDRSCNRRRSWASSV